MKLEALREAAAGGSIDTVLLTMCDMQGRLQGKRLTARYFLDEVLENRAEGCAYMLAVDIDMETVSGYDLTSWESGYGDFVLEPDVETLRPIPWLEKTALCTSDVRWHDGSPVAPSPRQILRNQLERLAEHGWRANVGTELEFMLFRNTYEDAWTSGYRNLEPANLYNVDYSMLGTSRVEPIIGRIRNGMGGAEMLVENSKGECNLGQHEINFRFGDALRACDDHTIYKNGAKEIAAEDGMALTFMSKLDAREGNSCHIHCSLAEIDGGGSVFADDEATFHGWMAGQLACLRELCLFYAPQINSYKRFAPGSFAPTAIAWGHDNRTVPLRVVGHGRSLRYENRMPGADVNPYLAVAAMIAAGLHGIDNGLELEDALEGNAYEAGKPQLPGSLHQARDLFQESAIAREAFGEEVVDHYLNYARVEIDAFAAAVTDWEKFRGFERL